ncbi:glycoside hydrolase family 5 protein [Dacryopinax primogenitus]|uniref:Glycoside hydrolase family 5 protein n=1 Tax=Dacryopinax primogenitus (strain DJM 731) TaxID=1858805 RepID=M5FYG0_DACPD|nr:glycoside hydrolase family 5 protein [Dacryopinax primogenitus]EJU01559.1 glycoside hydrolase family 5 protein [Dacryopinax primogenitus]
MVAINPNHHPSLSEDYEPGSTSSTAHDWSLPIRIQGAHFVDPYNRVLNLRGVNLSGASKTPGDHDPAHFLDENHWRGVSFVGRPFPLEQADEHLARLRRWGLTFGVFPLSTKTRLTSVVRLNVTWEAIEHSAPGEYDHDYLTYLYSLLSKFPAYGLVAFVSMHQDVFSRFSGGSGAPAWTLTSVGLDLDALEETGAAYLEGVRHPGKSEEDRGTWPTGYQKLAAATMNTLFWAGDTFASKLKVQWQGKEVGAQQFLQDRFLAAWEVLVQRLAPLPAVVGFQMMNEPHSGYVENHIHTWDYNTDLHLWAFPTPLQSMALGAGHPQRVAYYTRSFPFPTRQSGSKLINPKGRKCWREDGPTEGRCVWEMHGVWGWERGRGEAVALRENYFMWHPTTDKMVEWYEDFYFPFAKRWSERMHALSGGEKLIFLEPIPNEFCPPWPEEFRPKNFVYAPHWYDLNALFKKQFGNVSVNVQGLSRGMFLLKALYWGDKGAKENYAMQLRNVVDSVSAAGERPVVVGECGVPMDMNNAHAFKTGDFTWQSRMLDALISGLDSARASFTLWNYNPGNTDAQGDRWNGENFSFYTLSARALSSSSEFKDSALAQTNPELDDGGRVLSSLVRPYPAKVAGIPLSYSYSTSTGVFELTYASPAHAGAELDLGRGRDGWVPLDHPAIMARETEIFLPLLLTQGREVKVEGAWKWVYSEERQTLYVLQETTGEARAWNVKVRVRPALTVRQEGEWTWVWALLGVLLGVGVWFLIR